MITETVFYFALITHTEEEDVGLFLALANLLYCRGETSDILDVIYGFADDVQYFVNTQAVEAAESQVVSDELFDIVCTF